VEIGNDDGNTAKTSSTASANYIYSNARRYSILLLDDEKDITTVLKKGLEARGPFNVYTFTDPEKALQSLSDFFYDFMIIDIRLPAMNGFEFSQKAKQLTGISKVFFITASDNYYEMYKDKYPMLKGDCFIVKPVSLKSLIALLMSEIGPRAEREPYN
jgi:DNA-binding response OmpR family regulator